MRKINIILILASLLVLRVIVFSSTYADAICLLGVLGYMIAKKVLEDKKLESDIAIKVLEQEKQIKALVEEMSRVKNSSEGLRAAINMTKGK